ncbi:autotransporter outer membrane beta-barrel domain-containing protein [uncultured Gilliamella sp.]|uniref:autotransporter outer membrane beta-barrel domain-containing protein n=1 Tax=uncultured Gilliamella sp. TaxID=1193505 RepID=UPI0025D3BCB4|nr:autotransporter outer membrane beta-barrel domain-containing protein [uncultured Gilliamella sp.]
MKKIIVGLILAIPLSSLAQDYPSGLELQGTNIYEDTIDIPITANKGIVIKPGSNTTFEKNVNVNLSAYDPMNEEISSGQGLSGFTLDNAPATTIFKGDLTINMQEPTQRYHRITAIMLNGENTTVTVEGKTTLTAIDRINNNASSAISIGDSSLTLNGEADITGDISVSGGNLIFNGKSAINGNIYAEYGTTEFNAATKIIGNIEVESGRNELGQMIFHDETEIDGNIEAKRRSKIEFNNKTKINDGITVTSETGQVIFNNESTITTTDVNKKAIEAKKGSIIFNGKSTITGDIEASNNGTVNLNLASGSKIQGGANNNILNSNAGKIVIALAENASWDITNNKSYITELSGTGNIKFSNINYSNSYGKLIIEDLKGGINFNLRTDIMAEENDKIIVTRSAAGIHTLNIINNGTANTTGQEKLALVEIDNSASNNAEFRTTHAIELGGYVYNLNRDGNDWVLTGKHIKNTDDKPQITTTADASAGFLNGNYLMSYLETQTLLKRLGDMRNNGQFGDVWLRGFSGKLDSFSSGKLSKFDMNYHGFQFGADKQLSEDSPFVVGAFVGQTYGNPDYRKGNGSLRSFNTGIYATYLDNEGFYIDGVAKYARQRNHFKVKDTANNPIQGTGHTNGLGLSMELGKKFKFNSFYIEPQTQLSYNQQNSASIHATNGLKVKLGDYNSILGRASASFGYEIKSENNNLNVYVKTGIVREFDGDTYYKLNNSKENHSFKGNWWNNGVGVSAQLNQKHTIYFDLESSLGNKFDSLQVNGGYRYSF